MAGDANYASVSLLLHCDGADGSTTFTDNSPRPKAMTPNGVATVSTTQSKYGGASAKFSSGGSVTTPASAEFGFGTGDLTVEAWLYLTANAVSGGNTIVDFRASAGASAWVFNISNTGAGNMVGTYLSTSPDVTSGTNYLALNTQCHVAITRASGVWRIFVDGVQVGTATNSANLGSSNAVTIGNVVGGVGTTANFPGYIDDLRITKGVARYTASFTPPTAAFIDGMGQVSGVIRDSANALCARTVRLIRRDTGALLSSTVSDASTGVYSLPAPTLDEVQRIVLDDSGGTLYNDIIDRVIPA